MVPLDDRHTVLDWMIALDLPLILVAGSYVGTLSHTLTALDVLDRAGLEVAAVVVNETPGSAATLEETASHDPRASPPGSRCSRCRVCPRACSSTRSWLRSPT